MIRRRIDAVERVPWNDAFVVYGLACGHRVSVLLVHTVPKAIGDDISCPKCAINNTAAEVATLEAWHRL